MMVMWTSAVENLRQRDTDIRHIREVAILVYPLFIRVVKFCNNLTLLSKTQYKCIIMGILPAKGLCDFGSRGQQYSGAVPRAPGLLRPATQQ